MNKPLTLYYAPDNASLCVRLALLRAQIPFDTRLVDRSRSAQRDAAFLAMNPNGLIPVLRTPDATLYETAAILLWVSEQSEGLMPEGVARAEALTWLFWLSNTLHPALRMLFYPDQYIESGHDTLRRKTRERLNTYWDQIEARADWLDTDAGILGCYLAPMLRWAALYGGDTDWFDLSDRPRLLSFARKFETTDAAVLAATAEGLGPTPFSAPILPNPPEGSAT